MVITSLAGTTSIGKFGSACLANSARTMAGCPTKSIRTPYSRAASTLPSTSGRGAWSPPMASTAIVIMGGVDQAIPEKVPLERLTRNPPLRATSGRYVLNRFAFVVAAVGANVVRLLHLMAMRAFGQRRLFQKVVGAPRAGSSLRMPSFRVRHSNTPRFRPLGPDCRGFRPGNLLFFQPVLLQAREGSQSRVCGVRLTAALFVIQIRAAIRAQSPAVAAADDLHRQCQQHLFAQHIRQEQPFPCKKTNLRVVFPQPRFFWLFALWQRAVKQIERAMDFIHNGFQATSANQLDLGLDFACDANLRFEQLRGRIHFQRVYLLHFPGLVVDAAGRVTFADDLFPDGKVLDVKEHVFSASGANTHAFSLLRRLAAKSRKRKVCGMVRFPANQQPAINTNWHQLAVIGSPRFPSDKAGAVLRGYRGRRRPS